MTDRIDVPTDPTLEMCVAYLRAIGVTKPVITGFTESFERKLGTADEASVVIGLRAAIAVGSCAVPLSKIKRGWRPEAGQVR